MSTIMSEQRPYLVDAQRMAKALAQALQILASHRGAVLAATERSIEVRRANRSGLRAAFISEAPSVSKSAADIAVNHLDYLIRMQERLLEQFMCSEKAWISTDEMRLLCDIEQGRYQDRLTTYGIARHDLL